MEVYDCRSHSGLNIMINASRFVDRLSVFYAKADYPVEVLLYTRRLTNLFILITSIDPHGERQRMVVPCRRSDNANLNE
ncbi:hypothetical protein ALC57_00449 [Trachymyrmex cornetzi]|uniref:Uncharacterized protein n=1 Tax=Trachymyrmex cornetzi TaxID=471704 RepID=A0A151JRY0_9HYME|nr:hypothetical protein ALC57_00449 [Trachymyrmex cornetzi]